jgi:hypothetical protein
VQIDLAKKEWGDVVRELMLEKNESTSKLFQLFSLFFTFPFNFLAIFENPIFSHLPIISKGYATSCVENAAVACTSLMISMSSR